MLIMENQSEKALSFGWSHRRSCDMADVHSPQQRESIRKSNFATDSFILRLGLSGGDENDDYGDEWRVYWSE